MYLVAREIVVLVMVPSLPIEKRRGDGLCVHLMIYYTPKFGDLSIIGYFEKEKKANVRWVVGIWAYTGINIGIKDLTRLI